MYIVYHWYSYRIIDTNRASTQLTGKIGKINEELTTTYQKLLPEQHKPQHEENGVLKNDLKKCHKSDRDSVFQVLLNIVRNEGM